MGYGKMANRYLSQKDLCDRLHGTICRYKDVPVGVQFVTTNCLMLTDVVTGELVAKISPTDPDFDISSPELGYMNYANKDFKLNVVYVSRQPIRRYRQGLYLQCCEFNTIDGGVQRSPYGMNYFGLQGFKNMIMDIYPPLSQARSMLNEGDVEVAISKEIALKKIDSGLHLVYFKTKNIGWIKPDSMCVEMAAGEFDWVAERYLSRLGIEVKEKIIGQPA